MDIAPLFTEKMAERLKELAGHGRHFCVGCDERNSIDDAYFCLACGEVLCWQCTSRRRQRHDPFDGIMHPVCRCGHFFKRWDHWHLQAAKAFPKIFR